MSLFEKLKNKRYDLQEAPIDDKGMITPEPGEIKKSKKILKNTEKSVLNQTRKYLKITEKFEMLDGDKKISIEPSDDSLEIEFELNYENKVIGKQKNLVNLNYDNIDNISSQFEKIEKGSGEKLKKFLKESKEN